ncbi:iron complex outermembrane recepter protein [Azospirillum sp. RU38E]|nr:iron complex outermembrane recepter protein [Azospirillum sp. RU38E]SNT14312.1 iron complex outermembrane recepter protein [Azospirillum sp. RU37A]
MSPLSLRARSLASVALFALAPPALAETMEVADATGQMAEVIVVGQRDAPISIEPRGLSVSLGEEQFAAINAVNVEDLMKYAPNFFVRKRYIGDANGVPGFRGTHSTQSARTLVLVDGFVISNFLGNSFGFPPKWGVVGPGEVKQFDIVYGPYSSRYPGNSMGGIISIATKPPADGVESFATAQYFVQPYKQYGTDKKFQGYTGEAGFSWKQQDGPWSARLSYRRLENEGHPQQFYQLNTVTGGAAGTPVTGAVTDPDLITKTPVSGAYATDDTAQDQVRARIGYDFSNGWNATAMLVAWLSDGDGTNPQTYLRDANGNPVFTTANNRVQVAGKTYTLPAMNLSLSEKREFLGGLRLAGPLADWNVTLNLSHYLVDKQRSRTSTGYDNGIRNGVGTDTNQGDTGWWTGDLLLERQWGRHDLAVGINSNLYYTDQTTNNVLNWRAASAPSFASRTQGKTRQLGLFIDDEWQVADAVWLTGGARLDQWRAFDGSIGTQSKTGPRFQDYASRQKTAVNPTLGIRAELAEDWMAQLSLATATRFPTVGELFQGKFDSNNNFDFGSFDPNLKAETSRDANLMLHHKMGDVRLTGSLFYQRVEDAIFSQQGFNQFGVITTSFKNIDLVRQWGMEGIIEAVDVGLDGLDLDFNAAWIDAQTVRNRSVPASEGVQFPRIPKWRLNGNLRYRLAEDWKISTGWRYASRPNTNLEGTQRGDTYGYTSELMIFDAKLSWQVTDQAEFSFGVDNIGNDKAWVFHPYPQRTFTVELKWKG